ncbi:MAG: DUF1385 domain-containing protein [candidate division Zixibacteria bacterium]|nr:DUF1385 domain-containing protein [candidate division Zixibacteria bacterium]
MFTCCLANNPEKNVGGQAVIEGVMIRSWAKVATAVRRPDGQIVSTDGEFLPIVKRIKWLNVPIVRGVVGLFEMLYIGSKSLNFSAEVALAAEEEKKKKENPEKETKAVKKQSDWVLGLTTILALGLGILLFFFVPIWLSNLFGLKRNAVAFNFLAGGFRVAIFLAYLFVLSRFKDFQRIFQYHGAEHMTIYAFEAGDPLEIGAIRKYPTMHPRCGTSFLILVALLAIFIYSASDAAYLLVAGEAPNVFERFGYHLLLLPLVAGGSYEVLKWSARIKESWLGRAVIAPGIWLQKITTRPPSDDQIEVAIAALKGALPESVPAAAS